MSSPQIVQKKLKAIVFTDMADFTKLSSQDEQKALDLIQKQNDIIKPIVEKHNGEWLKEIGDGLLFSFDSSLDAVRCSIRIQESLKNEEGLNLRIGIHQGDIFMKDGDVFGDDVNITSRIESFAPIGGICISEKLYQDISSTPEIKSEYIGYRRLKGIEHEMKLRCISSKNITKYKSQKFPYYTGKILSFFGYLGFIGCVCGLVLSFFADEVTLTFLGLSGNIYQIMILCLAFIFLGYSNISFVKGISYKAQKNLVYLGYLIVGSILVFLIYKIITDPSGFYEEEIIFPQNFPQ